MPATVIVNFLTVVHKDSGGVATAFPDVCKTPSPAGPIPIPYPNIAMSSDTAEGSKKVTCDGNPIMLKGSNFKTSTGDEAGTAGGGIISSKTKGKAEFMLYSFDVKVEGKNVPRLSDIMVQNSGSPANTPPMCELQPPAVVVVQDLKGEKLKENTSSQKADRWKQRKRQIEAGKKSDDPEVRSAAERFERNNTAVEKAKLADDVYNPKKGPPEGWSNISNDREKLAKYGLETNDLEEPGSQFRAQVYEPKPDVFGNDIKPTVVFKGTTPSSMEDWKNNINQGLNKDSPYYENAVGIGKKLKQNGADVDISGHSLGGGLATAASRASGLPATTFNSAGLNKGTVAKYGGSPKLPVGENIKAFRVKGEVLTGLQEQSVKGTLAAAGVGFLAGGPVGALAGSVVKLGLSAGMADAAGVKYDLPGRGINPGNKHGMTQVINGLESQKREDQEKLSTSTGVT